MTIFPVFFQPDAAWPTTVSTTTITATTTHHLEWHECNFENEDLCGWQVFPAPPDYPFQWERTNGQILDEQGIEGPKHDHAEQPQSE